MQNDSQQPIPPSFPQPQPIVQPTPPPFMPETPAPKQSHTRLIFIIIAVVLSLIIIIGGVLYLTGILHGSNKNKPGQVVTVTSTDLDMNSLGSSYDNFASSGVKEFDASHKQATLAMYGNLIRGFNLDNSYFDDTSATLIGLGIARLALDDTSHQKTYREELYLSASSYIQKVPDGITDEYFIASSAENSAKQVFAKYEDQALTTKMRQILTSPDGVEADVRQNLGLGSKPLQPYTAIVLNFDNASAEQEQFAKEHYMFGAQPKMWVESYGKSAYILFSRNYAQDFINDPHGYVRSSVIHEFTHAQSSYVSGDLGHSIEERRAELFSGDKSAYYEVKQMFIYANVFCGKDPLQMLQDTRTDKLAFYKLLYKDFGLKTANNMVASWPAAFLGQPSTAVKDVNDLVGGLDGIMQKCIEQGKQDPQALNDRIRARANKLMDLFHTKTAVLQYLHDYLDQTYGMPTAAQQMSDYMHEIL